MEGKIPLIVWLQYELLYLIQNVYMRTQNRVAANELVGRNVMK